MSPAGIEQATFRFVAQHRNQCATAVRNRNEYQKYFLGGKCGQYVGPYRRSVPIVLKSMSLNLLEPSGPVWACNWITLPLQNTLRYKQAVT